MTVFWLRYRDSRIPLRKGETVVGRSPYCSVVVNSRRVSRQHCVITLKDDALSIRDLGSANGTWVNGEAVTQHVTLSLGALIEVGDEALEVEVSSQPTPARLKATQKDLPIHLRDIEEDAETTTVTHAQASSVALIESLVANGSGVRSPSKHFDTVKGAIEQYLGRSSRAQSVISAMDLERLRRCIEATVSLDDSRKANAWRLQILEQLSQKNSPHSQPLP